MSDPGLDERAFRCPRPDCRHVFRDPDGVPGRLMRCPACARPMNARPLAMERELERRERQTRGGRGDPDLARLPLAILADNVRSLWNVGSMFRTADGCGAALLVLAGVTGCPPRDAIAKTALGAERAVAWRYRADELAAVRELEDDGWVPVALENAPDAVPLAAFEWPARPCLVVGNEVRGVSPQVLEACPRRVTIPMRGAKTTLNVAVALGVAAYRAAAILSERR
jgi:tRNA G18 (ribose-2'-O)-methylase SpoU